MKFISSKSFPFSGAEYCILKPIKAFRIRWTNTYSLDVIVRTYYPTVPNFFSLLAQHILLNISSGRLFSSRIFPNLNFILPFIIRYMQFDGFRIDNTSAIQKLCITCINFILFMLLSSVLCIVFAKIEQ